MDAIDLSSESDSDNEFLNRLLLIRKSYGKKIWKSSYMSKRKTHGEFKLTSEFSDEKFKNYFRMTRNDFKEVHAMIASDLEDQGYGGHERISTEEKLAVFLR